MGAQGLGIGVGGDNGLGASLDDIPKARGGDVGDVHQHTKAIHFSHDLAAKNSQATAGAFLVDAVSNIVAVTPHQGHSTHAQLVEAAQGL